MDTFGDNCQTVMCLGVVAAACKPLLSFTTVKPALALQYGKRALRACLVKQGKHSVSKGPDLSEHPESQEAKKFEGSQT